uniref:Thrombospondin-like N-terminal domain-containing protein n=1 Tax=Hucho hucho TaxID=62062 RepID=A0A4W5MS38_9TELE
MGLFKLYFLHCIFAIFPGKLNVRILLRFGVDPALRINVFDELKFGESFAGVFQVQGFHNESRAFLFQDSWRNVRVKEDVAEVMLQKLRDKTEFTVLATLKQERLNSGVLLSIHYAEHRYLELESSWQRNEIRLHYRTRDQRQHTEVFPYSLADDHWHKLSVAVSVSHVVLHVDCNSALRFEHTDSVIAFRYTRMTTLRLPCSTALQRQYVRCGAYVGFIERMRRTVCVDGLTEMVAEGEC